MQSPNTTRIKLLQGWIPWRAPKCWQEVLNLFSKFFCMSLFLFSFFKGDLLKLEVVSCHSIESSFIIFIFIFIFVYVQVFGRREKKHKKKDLQCQWEQVQYFGWPQRFGWDYVNGSLRVSWLLMVLLVLSSMKMEMECLIDPYSTYFNVISLFFF